MDLDIGIKDIEQSNDFLASLWAEIEKDFGKGQFIYYAPRKDKKEQKIHFGIMDIGIAHLSVGITYKDNVSIVKILFEYEDNSKELELISPLGQRLKQAVKKARRNKENYEKFFVKIGINSYHALSSYKGSSFITEVSTNEGTEITFPIFAHIKSQVSSKMFPKLNQIMDFLSVETNAPFWRDYKYHIGIEQVEISPKEVYQIPAFIDELSVKDDYLVISEAGKNFVDYIANSYKLDEDLALFLKACYHYHTARKYDAQLHNYPIPKVSMGETVKFEINIGSMESDSAQKKGSSQTEIATTLYLSALEVITLIGFQEEKCRECGQPKFKISKRVKSLAQKYLNQQLANEFIDYYDKRSKYLHKGENLSDDSLFTNSFPLLDKDSEHGCKMTMDVPVDNIREHTGYMLRKFYREYFAEKCNGQYIKDES
ncbi:hypothetical protein [Metabacillus rhizolycopersici]|uniref:Apea-like HEPN domain-containing protein n=1 Tax=Metabacillus rhizolycopersici TaxID=2875709 RepID=A0ABS7UXL6_9BACI|nr:hypothetical protein [Metabacillus rhizolycopersici]MBZ5753045.1 hypothetical protein [Metabacillus rhizolycopersici]